PPRSSDLIFLLNALPISSIGYTRDPQTQDLLLSGQGQQHIGVTVAKLRRRFGVELNLKPPRIPYRETITAKAEAHGRHKKQTGGDRKSTRLNSSHVKAPY